MSLLIAVDAMGGDHAPAIVVDGALQAVERDQVDVALVGPVERLRDELARHGPVAETACSLFDASGVVDMAEAPLAALRRMPRASIRVAASLVSTGRASAVFSAGHSGATFLAARSAFGLLPGVERPALAVTVPTQTGAAVLLDVGANVTCRPHHLVQFAILGSAYAGVTLSIDTPRVGLLSIGEEAGKGNELIRRAHERLGTSGLNFIGNLEARDLFSGRADVVVCDGFTGNVALKVGEGLVESVGRMIREEMGAALVSQIGGLLTRRALERFRQRVDYAEHGAAVLLGVDGITLVGHGRSSSRAVASGIGLAARLARQRVIDRMRDAVARGHVPGPTDRA